jgi:hypothetical protein
MSQSPALKFEIHTGPTWLETEALDNFVCQASVRPDGERYLIFGGLPFPSVPHANFGLYLTRETTQQEAQTLAHLINKHCPALWAAFFDRSLTEDLYEINEHGLAQLD